MTDATTATPTAAPTRDKRVSNIVPKKIRVIGVRPRLPFCGRARSARAEDAVFRPHFIPANYVPKIGHRINRWQIIQ